MDHPNVRRSVISLFSLLRKSNDRCFVLLIHIFHIILQEVSSLFVTKKDLFVPTGFIFLQIIPSIA